MSRQRFIYPEIFQSDDFTSHSLGARLLFIGLFTLADDYGRGKASPRLLKAAIFPADDLPVEDVKRWLGEILDRGTIRLYRIDDVLYYDIPSWEKWQRPKYKSSPKIPPFQAKSQVRANSARDPGQSGPEVARDPGQIGAREGCGLGSGLGGVGLGREGKGDHGSATSEIGANDLSLPSKTDPEEDPEETPDPDSKWAPARAALEVIRSNLRKPTTSGIPTSTEGPKPEATGTDPDLDAALGAIGDTP